MHNTLDCDRGFQFSANGSSVDDKQKAKVIVPYPQEGFWFLSLFGNCSEYEIVFIIIEEKPILLFIFFIYKKPIQ